jgi:hypothetical protein
LSPPTPTEIPVLVRREPQRHRVRIGVVRIAAADPDLLQRRRLPHRPMDRPPEIRLIRRQRRWQRSPPARPRSSSCRTARLVSRSSSNPTSPTKPSSNCSPSTSPPSDEDRCTTTGTAAGGAPNSTKPTQPYRQADRVDHGVRFPASRAADFDDLAVLCAAGPTAPASLRRCRSRPSLPRHSPASPRPSASGRGA